MKRICEIYDISKEYEMPTGTVLIIVSDIEKDKIISILLNTKLKEDMVFNTKMPPEPSAISPRCC